MQEEFGVVSDHELGLKYSMALVIFPAMKLGISCGNPGDRLGLPVGYSASGRHDEVAESTSTVESKARVRSMPREN